LIENLGEVQVPDIIAARAQMGMSLAFHIVFACVGVAMPLVSTPERKYISTAE